MCATPLDLDGEGAIFIDCSPKRFEFARQLLAFSVCTAEPSFCGEQLERFRSKRQGAGARPLHRVFKCDWRGAKGV